MPPRTPNTTSSSAPSAEVRHFKRPTERPFTREDRERVTLLFGGLTLRHEALIHAGLESVGYRPQVVPTPEKADFQAGKEYGNNGQCNPTYFTVGALVNYLKKLRDEDGIPTERILDEYVFLTAGACGPCRFGMYEAEYRLALRNAGFDGFRVLLFQQKAGLEQSDVESGLTFDVNFFLTLLNAVMIGDLLNEVAYQIRPYEVEAGATDRALARCVHVMQKLLRDKNYDEIQGGRVAGFLKHLTPFENEQSIVSFLDQLRGDHYLEGLRECARIIDEEVEVDFLRAKPITKVTGEFWAQTTEGDGNFRMFPFLESQGSEVIVEPVTTWLNYLLHQAIEQRKDHERLAPFDDERGVKRWWNRSKARWDGASSRFHLRLAQRILLREYDRMREALGGTTHGQIDQLELQRVGHPYYNARSQGGEGHLEVAKNIYYMNHDLAHLVLSLKPFGCMPSTQSDGAQAAVVSHFPNMLYLPIETSGEGDVNAHSRVQMALGEAKVKCRDEFKRAVEKTGLSLEELRERVEADRELRRPLQTIAERAGFAGKGARFAFHVAERAGVAQ